LEGSKRKIETIKAVQIMEGANKFSECGSLKMSFVLEDIKKEFNNLKLDINLLHEIKKKQDSLFDCYKAKKSYEL
jgi:hypothetical protein